MQTVNFNTSCFKQAAHWGYDKYYNICNGVGDWQTVYWGDMTYVWNTLGIVFFTSIIAAAGMLMFSAYKAQKKIDELNLPF